MSGAEASFDGTLDPIQIASLEESLGRRDLAEFLDRFLETVPSRLELLETEWRAGDEAAWRRTLHSMKGMCGFMGAKLLNGAVASAETDLHRGARGDLAEALRRLRAAWLATRPEVEHFRETLGPLAE